MIRLNCVFILICPQFCSRGVEAAWKSVTLPSHNTSNASSEAPQERPSTLIIPIQSRSLVYKLVYNPNEK